MQLVHGEQRIVDRGEPFGIPGEVVDGNDPIASWHALRRAFQWCRRKRRPFMLEPHVSRLHGHSSSSGASRVDERTRLPGAVRRQVAGGRTGRRGSRSTKSGMRPGRRWRPPSSRRWRNRNRGRTMCRRHTYAPSPVDAVYPDDYTGLPQ